MRKTQWRILCAKCNEQSFRSFTNAQDDKVENNVLQYCRRRFFNLLGCVPGLILMPTILNTCLLRERITVLTMHVSFLCGLRFTTTAYYGIRKVHWLSDGLIKFFKGRERLSQQSFFVNRRALHFPQTADTRCLHNTPFIIFVKGTAVMPPNVILSVSEVSEKPSPRGEGGLTVRSGRMRGT